MTQKLHVSNRSLDVIRTATTSILLVSLLAPAMGAAHERNATFVGPPTDADAVHGSPLALERDEAAPMATVPGRLIVKYTGAVDACAHCLLARGDAFASTTGTGSLDRLHDELGVHSARSVFFDRHGRTGASARSAFDSHVERVRGRHSHRTRRAAPGATVPDLTNVYELLLNESVNLELAAARYAADPAVAYASPVREVHASYLPNDPFLGSTGTWGQSYADLWGMHAINASAAWDVSAGAGTVIAVVDTGIDFTHADLTNNVWANVLEVPDNGVDDDDNGYVDDIAGWDFRNDDNEPFDRNGHGTHVAATAAAVGDDGYGVAGLAFEASIMAVQGLSDDGSGVDSDLAKAIAYAADNGADVANNSWGGFGLSEVVYDAINYADALGMLVVAASGNDGRYVSNDLLYLPHGHPKGLTVGALHHDGALAGFSNYGPGQSIVAPGVDILSARSDTEVFNKEFEVAGDWLRLQGTSMAAPHVAGAAAVLLASDPSLTTAELRWHLELNAVQPAGYEAELRNDTYGYGVLDASAMFAPVPVTARVTAPNLPDWHAFQELRPVPGDSGELAFTSTVAEPWSITAAVPLTAAATVGSGDTEIDLEIDASAVPPGVYTSEVRIDTPTALDPVTTFDATVTVHADHRDGAPVVLSTNGRGTILGYAPATAGSATRTLAAWLGSDTEYGLNYAVVDSNGNATAPTPVGATSVGDIRATSDGHGFLLVWRDFYYSDEGIHFVRIGADGGLLDSVPVRIVTRRDKNCQYYQLAGAGFDGTDYWIAFIDRKYCGSPKSSFFVARVRADGSFTQPRRVLKLKTLTWPAFDCRYGGCMLAWVDQAAVAIDEFGKYVRVGWAMALVGDESHGEPVKIATDLYGLSGLTNDGENYMALSRRDVLCAQSDFCRSDVVGVRIDGNTGAPLDADALSLTNTFPSERIYPSPGGLAYDGSDYIVSFQKAAVDDSPFEDGSYIFANRVALDGAVLTSDPLGALVESSGRSSQSRVATTATGATVVYENGEGDELVEPYPHPFFTKHKTQRMFRREPDAATYPEIEIGALGEQTVAERAVVRFRVAASGLDPATTVYSATGLPPGAVFDEASRIFHWIPEGDAVGVYPGAVFSAVDAGSSVEETVDFAVTEAVVTASGVVVLGDGTPVGGIALDVKGTIDRRRTVYTGVDGSFAIGSLGSGRPVKIRIGKPSKKEYRSDPKSLVFEPGGADIVLPTMTVLPK